MTCEDCGFILADISELNFSRFEECPFCKNQYFYHKYPLDVSFFSFLGKKIACYLCEATYNKNASLEYIVQNYNYLKESEIKKSESSRKWQERIEQYQN